jgi:hypothetical protein
LASAPENILVADTIPIYRKIRCELGAIHALSCEAVIRRAAESLPLRCMRFLLFNPKT